MRSLLTALCAFFAVQTYAATIDSVGVENNNGNQVILHKVAPKESYYSIGRLYNVAPKEIISFNNNISLNIGTLIKVPTQRPFAIAGARNNNSAKAEAIPAGELVEYKVGPKESLFAISRKFGTTVDNIKLLNNLTSNNLSIGQVLKIKQGQATAVTKTDVGQTLPVHEQTKLKVETAAQTHTTSPAGANTPTEPVEASTGEAPKPVIEKPKNRAGRLGVSEINEKGIAVSFDDESLDNSKMLALHKTAPIGTIVRVTNPMTDRVTFVKVVGKFTENETTKDAIIVLTKATADQLGALDKRFLVNIDYAMPNE